MNELNEGRVRLDDHGHKMPQCQAHLYCLVGVAKAKLKLVKPK